MLLENQLLMSIQDQKSCLVLLPTTPSFEPM